VKPTLLFLICCLYLLPGHAFAWFVGSRESPVPHDDGSRTVDGMNPCFVMFENPSSGTTRERESCLLSCDTRNFSNILKLDARIPLKVLSRRDLTPRESLDALLYADLQLRQIMQELSQLKKRTDMILKQVSIPYLEKSFLKGSDRGRSLKGEKQELSKKELELAYRVGRDFSFSLVSPGSSPTEYCFKNQVIAGGDDLKPGKFVSSRAVSSGLQPSVQKESFSGGQGLSGVDKRVMAMNGVQESGELPWLFRAGLDFFRYAANHRFEIFFYGLFVFMIFYLVSLKVRE